MTMADSRADDIGAIASACRRTSDQVPHVIAAAATAA